MTLEELYRAYRAVILPGTEQMHLDFIRERIIAANGMLSYFLLNHLGVGVEDTHCICIMFIFRIGNETGVQTISLSKIESNPQKILSPEKNRKIIEWLQTGELRRGFPDLDIEIGSICESCGEHLPRDGWRANVDKRPQLNPKKYTKKVRDDVLDILSGRILRAKDKDFLEKKGLKW